MSEKNLVTKAALLRASSSPRAGVLELSASLHVGPAKLIGLLDEMKEEGLIEVREVHGRRAGRPKKQVKASPLGTEYLRAYEALVLKPLRSRRPDLLKAVDDARYARRLESRGFSTPDLFLELSSLAKQSRKITR